MFPTLWRAWLHPELFPATEPWFFDASWGYMKIGIVGYQGSGKSTLFEWLTGVRPDPALAHASQSAMAPVPEPRVEKLCAVYKPKKVTLAAIELVDTAGLSRTHEGNAMRLAQIRE